MSGDIAAMYAVKHWRSLMRHEDRGFGIIVSGWLTASGRYEVGLIVDEDVFFQEKKAS